ncbi:hypothetical protein DIPPA_34114 [Diplonema papillatum]|nr:hypothetical protein DIPPA_34114 [Diplonema papillatum]
MADLEEVRFSDRRASPGDSSARASFTPDSNATRSIRETCEGREPAAVTSSRAARAASTARAKPARNRLQSATSPVLRGA